MNRQFENKTKLLVEEIQKSNLLSSDEKIDYETMLISACEGTNGISQEDKLQRVSESVFEIM